MSEALDYAKLIHIGLAFGKVLPKEVHIDLSARIAAMSPEEKLAEAQRMAVELGVRL